MNLAVIQAAMESAGVVSDALHAVATPEPGFCCVTLKRVEG
jgi:hypothetical protein